MIHKYHNLISFPSKLILLSIFIFSFSSAQTNQSTSVEKIADEYSIKLERKVLLTKEQKNEVKNIIIILLKDVQNQDSFNKLKDKAEEKIVSLFNEKQKAKYNIIKEDWWNSIKENAGK